MIFSHEWDEALFKDRINRKHKENKRKKLLAMIKPSLREKRIMPESYY